MTQITWAVELVVCALLVVGIIFSLAAVLSKKWTVQQRVVVRRWSSISNRLLLLLAIVAALQFVGAIQFCMISLPGYLATTEHKATDMLMKANWVPAVLSLRILLFFYFASTFVTVFSWWRSSGGRYDPSGYSLTGH